MQTLNEFLKEVREEVDRFERWWRQQHENDPENFPLEMPDGDEGIWWEQFNIGNHDDSM